MSWPGLLSQLLEIVLAIALAPMLSGWVNQWRAWLQNKSAPSLLQPYRLLHKLFNKESVVADNASRLFRAVPYVVFGCMLLACAIVPTLSTDLPLAPAADAIALVGLFALARVFISLAAMDLGTAFGTMGARREMLIGFLAEPALLMVLFSASLLSKSTSLTTIVETLAHREIAIYPGLAFAGLAFAMVALAVTGFLRFRHPPAGGVRNVGSVVARLTNSVVPLPISRAKTSQARFKSPSLISSSGDSQAASVPSVERAGGTPFSFGPAAPLRLVLRSVENGLAMSRK